MDIIQEYLNSLHRREEQNPEVYPHPVDVPNQNYGHPDDLCQPGQKWNPQLNRCVPLGDGENEDFNECGE